MNIHGGNGISSGCGVHSFLGEVSEGLMKEREVKIS
jgi:hypothetical protein